MRRPNVAHKNRKLGWLSCFQNCESFVFKRTISSGKCFLSMLYFGLPNTSLKISDQNSKGLKYDSKSEQDIYILSITL